MGDFWADRRTQRWLTGELTKAMWNALPPRLPIGLLPNGAMVSNERHRLLAA